MFLIEKRGATFHGAEHIWVGGGEVDKGGEKWTSDGNKEKRLAN